MDVLGPLGPERVDVLESSVKKKPTQKPTARWIFLCFGGIHEYSLGSEPAQVTDINTVQETIIDVLGPRYRQIYS